MPLYLICFEEGKQSEFKLLNKEVKVIESDTACLNKINSKYGADNYDK